MKRLGQIVSGLCAVLVKRRRDAILDEELRTHLALLTDQNIKRGMPPEGAYRAAKIALGGKDQIMESVRDHRGLPVLETLWQDIRYGARMLRKSPGFAAVAILTLALGIGGTTAIFSLVNTAFLRSLPFPDSNRIVRVLETLTAPDGHRSTFSTHGQTILAIHNQNRVFDTMVALDGESMTLLDRGAPERVSVVFQSSGWASTLGVEPVLGRGFTLEEESRGAASGVALLSYGLWQTRFGATSSILKASVNLDGKVYRIVGVLPRGFRFPYNADFWIPAIINPADKVTEYAVFAHLRPGITRMQAQANLDTIASRIRQQYPATTPGFGLGMITLRENFLGNQDGPMLALLCAVGFLLLMACINVANLLLARSVTRTREFAVRAVLGATRRRQLQQVLVESILLASLGCALGIALAVWLNPFMRMLTPANFTTQIHVAHTGMNLRVLSFALLVSLIAGIFSGAAPAFASTGVLEKNLKEMGRSGTGGRSRRRVLDGFVVAETAIAMVLLTGAGVMVRNFDRLVHRDLGFDAHKLVVLSLTPSDADFPLGPRRAALFHRVLEEVQRTPGVEAAGLTTVNPLGGGTWSASVIVQGMEAGNNNSAYYLNHRLISPRLFDVMRIPVLRGRSFTEQDNELAAGVAIVSQRTAERFWPHQDALGKQIRTARPNSPWLTVVGIVGNVYDVGDPGDPVETWYLPYAQNASTAAAESVYVMVRAHGGAELVPGIERAIWRVDRSLAAYDVSAMDDYYSDSLKRDRLGAQVMIAFGVFGLLLAALGVYGVMSFGVASRMREIGIRMALGADQGEVLRFILRRGVRLAGAGLFTGILVAAALNRTLASLLAAVRPLEFTVLGVTGAMLASVALAACYLPARRAMHVNPTVALRDE